MRILMVIGLFLLISNCEDKQSQQKPNHPEPNSAITKDTLPNKPPASKEPRSYPKLTSENAMDFFLEYEKENKENKVRITTDFGTIDIQLYNETLFHRANFIFLVKQHYFDNTQFYRIVNNFVIQGGNSDEIPIAEKRLKIGKYLLPPDTRLGFKHDRGVISMPSSEIEDAYKLASPYEFFIVQQRGGAHHLDGKYTAFGKVIDGMEVVDEIAAQETDESEWPLRNVYIRKIEIID